MSRHVVQFRPMRRGKDFPDGPSRFAGSTTATTYCSFTLMTKQETARWLNVSNQFLEIGRIRGYGPPATVLSPRVVRYRKNAVLRAYGQVLLWPREDLRCQPLNADPEMPAENRFADNWRPLVSVADSLGYGVQACEAMMKFAHEDADVRIVLLSDIRKAFDPHDDRLPSTVLLSALHDMDADWNEFHGIRGDGNPHKLRASELASILREFRIRPHNIWPPNRTAESKSAKGYRRSQFEEIWRVYCADDGTTAHTRNIMRLRRADDGTA
jgi:Protein of unknown function (DUF3631)